MMNRKTIGIAISVCGAIIFVGVVYGIISHYHFKKADGQRQFQDAIVEAAHNAVEEHHLTVLKDYCLQYRLEEGTTDPYIVDVYEDHSDPKCGGDPLTTPRLFSIAVSKQKQAVATDRGSPDGTFHLFNSR